MKVHCLVFWVWPTVTFFSSKPKNQPDLRFFGALHFQYNLESGYLVLSAGVELYFRTHLRLLESTVALISSSVSCSDLNSKDFMSFSENAFE